jgi:hypothetical protein
MVLPSDRLLAFLVNIRLGWKGKEPTLEGNAWMVLHSGRVLALPVNFRLGWKGKEPTLEGKALMVLQTGSLPYRKTLD